MDTTKETNPLEELRGHLGKLQELANIRAQMFEGRSKYNNPALLHAIAYNIEYLCKYAAKCTIQSIYVMTVLEDGFKGMEGFEGMNGVSPKSIEELDKMLARQVLECSRTMAGTELPYWTSLPMHIPKSCRYTLEQVESIILAGLQREEEKAKAVLERLTSNGYERAVTSFEKV